MASESSQNLFISAQVRLVEDDIDGLVELLQSSKIPEEYSAILKTRIKLDLQDLKKESGEIKSLLQAQKYQRAWELFDHLKARSQRYQDLSMEFLGGLAIRTGGIDRGMADAAQHLLKDYCSSIGIDWSPVVIIAGGTGEDLLEEAVTKADPAEPDPVDSLVRIPVPRWDYWFLPLTARSLGYWV